MAAVTRGQIEPRRRRRDPQRGPRRRPRHARDARRHRRDRRRGAGRGASRCSPTAASPAPRTASWPATSRPRPSAAARSPRSRDGDTITIDVDARRIDVELDDEEIAERVAAYEPPDADVDDRRADEVRPAGRRAPRRARSPPTRDAQRRASSCRNPRQRGVEPRGRSSIGDVARVGRRRPRGRRGSGPRTRRASRDRDHRVVRAPHDRASGTRSPAAGRGCGSRRAPAARRRSPACPRPTAARRPAAPRCGSGLRTTALRSASLRSRGSRARAPSRTRAAGRRRGSRSLATTSGRARGLLAHSAAAEHQHEALDARRDGDRQLRGDEPAHRVADDRGRPSTPRASQHARRRRARSRGSRSARAGISRTRRSRAGRARSTRWPAPTSAGSAPASSASCRSAVDEDHGGPLADVDDVDGTAVDRHPALVRAPVDVQPRRGVGASGRRRFADRRPSASAQRDTLVASSAPAWHPCASPSTSTRTLHHYWDVLSRAARRPLRRRPALRGAAHLGHHAPAPRAGPRPASRTRTATRRSSPPTPYPGAVETVRAWHEAGHFIHITSHRAAPRQERDRDAGCEQIGLPYDELYCSLRQDRPLPRDRIDLLSTTAP